MLNDVWVLGALDLGHHQGTNPQHVPGPHAGGLLPRVLLGWEVGRFRVWRSYDEDLGYDRRDVQDPYDRRPP